MSTSNWSDSFGGWDESPVVCVADVIRRWTRMIGRERPWSAMPRDDLHGLMRPILSELLNEARDADHSSRQRRLVHAAHDHGIFRAALRLSQAELITEIEIARDALEGALRRTGMSHRAVHETLVALEAELELAQRAAVRGWSRGRLRRPIATGNWFDRLLEELD